MFFPRPKIESTLLEFTPRENLVEVKNPKNLELITKLFFNQRRKMIKKNFIRLFKNYDVVASKINIKLTDRPQKLTVNEFL